MKTDDAFVSFLKKHSLSGEKVLGILAEFGVNSLYDLKTTKEDPDILGQIKEKLKGYPIVVKALDGLSVEAIDNAIFYSENPGTETGQIGTDQGVRTLSPAGSQTPSTYTVQFDATSGNADKGNLVRALQKGQEGGPSATSSISLFIAWEREGAASATRPPNWKCASIRF